MDLKEIPIVEVSEGFPLDSMRMFASDARSFAQKATQHVPKTIIKTLDRVSKSFLERSGQSYQDEIAEVARILNVPGAYFLNANFEWGCTTRVSQTMRGPEMVRVLDWSTPGLG